MLFFQICAVLYIEEYINSTILKLYNILCGTVRLFCFYLQRAAARPAVYTFPCTCLIAATAASAGAICFENCLYKRPTDINMHA